MIKNNLAGCKSDTEKCKNCNMVLLSLDSYTMKKEAYTQIV